jgi:hypothetical protein
MSKEKGMLQKTDPEFLSQATTINNLCRVNAPMWNIDPEQLMRFDALLPSAQSAYTANTDRATKNATTSVAKKAAFGELKNFLGTFINALEGNNRVPDQDIELMGLRPRHPHAHQPLPPPNEQPVLSVQRQHDEITVYAARPEHDQPTSTVGPAHHYGFMLRYKMEGEAEYRTVISTRLHHTLFFEQTDEGKRITLAAAWVNPRLEPGPWCEDLSEVSG